MGAFGGSGVPSGGTTDQVLAKQSNANGDVGWNDPGGGGSVHELQLALTSDAEGITGNVFVAVPFDSVLIDTDAYVTTGTHTFDAVTVPIGGGALVPAGLAGDYDVSAEVTASFDTGADPWPDIFSVLVAIMVNGTIAGQGCELTTVAIPTTPNVEAVTLIPLKVTLAEGDVVWVDFLNGTNVGGTYADGTISGSVYHRTQLILRKR